MYFINFYLNKFSLAKGIYKNNEIENEFENEILNFSNKKKDFTNEYHHKKDSGMNKEMNENYLFDNAVIESNNKNNLRKNNSQKINKLSKLVTNEIKLDVYEDERYICLFKVFYMC